MNLTAGVGLSEVLILDISLTFLHGGILGIYRLIASAWVFAEGEHMHQ